MHSRHRPAAEWREDAAGERGVPRKRWVCFPDCADKPRGALAKARHPWAEMRKTAGLQGWSVNLLGKAQAMLQPVHGLRAGIKKRGHALLSLRDEPGKAAAQRGCFFCGASLIKRLHHTRACCTPVVARRARAAGPTGSSGCQGSQAVRGEWWATTSSM